MEGGCWNFQNWCFLEKVKVFDLKQGREVAAGEKILSLPETEPLMSQLGKKQDFHHNHCWTGAGWNTFSPPVSGELSLIKPPKFTHYSSEACQRQCTWSCQRDQCQIRGSLVLNYATAIMTTPWRTKHVLYKLYIYCCIFYLANGDVTFDIL